MAKRNDRYTKRNSRVDKINSETFGRKLTRPMYDLGSLSSAYQTGKYKDEASYRPRGRRGVRSRAREERIARANGTVSVPAGNSDTKEGSGS